MAIAVAAMMLPAFYACNSDKIANENLYTFTDQMIGQYLNDSSNFSEFSRLLDTTKVIGLLKSYGTYTCFAPTNQAMHDFYKLRGKKSLADFPSDSLKIIAYDHIINGTAISYAQFVNGRLPSLSMSDRYISISYSGAGTFVDNTAMIVTKDIELHNGVMHVINQVLNPTHDGIVEALSKMPKYSLFYNALIETKLADSLLLIRDDSYHSADFEHLVKVPLEQNSWYYEIVPPARKYGYTILVEKNETMNSNGITDMQSLKRYAAQIYDEVYPEDAGITDVTDRRNSLNRFVAYHLINKQLSRNRFIDLYDTQHMLKTQDMYEYIETMCPNTLIEVKKDRLLNKTNIFNYIRETGQSITLNLDTIENDATNGVFHEIDGMLVYSKAVENELSTKRLRFDAASFFPELTNNDFRGSRLAQNTVPDLYNSPSLNVLLPRGYIDRIQSSEQTVVGYLPGYHKFQDYEGDEIFLSAASGSLYDFTITLPPIPAGTYEVRFGYLTNGKRGVAQLYFDGIPAGVPLNLNNSATVASIGYEKPGTVASDPNGYENDKMMRNRGYMKGPACYRVVTPGWSDGDNARYSPVILRKILGTYVFKEAGHHTLTVKGLSGGEFMLDYLEFVPTSVLESEDIY
ncbi:MAG: hypothetical protein BGN96_14090 [Bacteroidales bacterium 45-6]|nr:MAG: hypothetical protein BGN96_14090 [Bacteroidales bacterium 45-6]